MKDSLKEKIGQLFLIGFDSTATNDHVKLLSEKYKVGNFILFKRNVENYCQLKSLCENLKKLSEKNIGIEPFIAIDEEGGSVSRASHIIGDHPGAYMLGLLNDEEITYNTGLSIGKKLNDLGINVNLAPVCDVNSNPNNPVIGIRAFSSDFNIVKSMTLSMCNGYLAANIIPVIKHFPGHGDTDVDSHIGLPKLDLTIEELKERELKPFQYCIQNNVPAVMVSHVIINSIDPNFPSSLSKKVITDLLIDEMGFGGLIFSDCFEMGAIISNYPIEEAVVTAINAGIDIIDISHCKDVQIRAIEAIYKAVEEGIITEERIDKSYEKIMKFKKEKTDYFQDVAKKSFVLNGDFSTFDYKNSIVIAPKPFAGTEAENPPEHIINISWSIGSFLDIPNYSYKNKFDQYEMENILSRVEKFDNVILAVDNFNLNKCHLNLYNKLKGKNIFLISLRIFNDNLPFEPTAHVGINQYTNNSVKAFNDFLTNDLNII